MSTIKIPQNGLPQGLNNIPFGQVFILTNPFLGITSKSIQMMEFILSMAKQYDQGHIINAMPVDYSGLWDCFSCKVRTEDGDQILVSDKDSLIEMLCEFWGLDYKEVCKSIVIKGRYKKVTFGGDSHPARINVSLPEAPIPVMKKDDSTISLNFLQATSRGEAYGNIRSTIIDNFNYGFGITLDEIIELYKTEERNRKTYTLDIQIERKKVYEKGKPVQKIKSCELYLIDNFGAPHHFSLSAQAKAIYLTFLLYEGGLRIKEISGNEEFYNAFKKIYLQVPYHSKAGLPKNFDNLNDTGSSQYTYFLQKIGEIRDSIMDETNDNSARTLFAVEGNSSTPFGVAGSTYENRVKVKEEFGLN